jgi:hypothetical protein
MTPPTDHQVFTAPSARASGRKARRLVPHAAPTAPPRRGAESQPAPTTTGSSRPHQARICELAKTEWGVAYERGRTTACESEQTARQLQAASGGELVYRRTWITT